MRDVFKVIKGVLVSVIFIVVFILLYIPLTILERSGDKRNGRRENTL
jgi:Fe2+ transport system protein B